MRKVIVSTYMTLDGRVDEVQDWAVPYDDDGAAKLQVCLLGLAAAGRVRPNPPPAAIPSGSGSYWSSRLHAAVALAASATSVRTFAPVVASSASAGPVRAIATTGAPASANARAIPRPKPRLAPTTTVVLPDKSLIVVFPLRVRGFRSAAPVLVVAAPPEVGLVATE
jgi:hypothetical protein